MMFCVVSYIIKINGIYDVLCALAILKVINVPILGELHLSMMKDYDNTNILFERFLAYWIFTYGIIRIVDNGGILVPLSYTVECLFFVNECWHESVHVGKATFVALSSLFMCYISFSK